MNAKWWWLCCTFASFTFIFLCFQNNTEKLTNISFVKVYEEEEPKMEEEVKECDVLEGRWVYEEETKPVYNATTCPFLSDQVSCQKNGRPDSLYQNWVWQPNDCHIPRFDGKDMLERLRDKRVVLVGDSLNRNQWESLACLLYSSLHPSQAFVNVKKSDYKVFKAKSYNCSVEFYWNPLLVHLQLKQANGTRVLNLDKLHPSAPRWRTADFIVFNTGHWWKHQGKLKQWDMYRYKGKLIRDKDMKIEVSLEIGLKTWGDWMKKNIDPTKTKVFFRSLSPEHKGKHVCLNQTKPMADVNTALPTNIVDTVEKSIRQMSSMVKYLNITKISKARRDGHPSYYATKQGKMFLSAKDDKYRPDCSHWCLPGVPDTWNRLLYASMFFHNNSWVL